MVPLFLFLASSFNVELVYVILKGITQFSYITDKKNSSGFTEEKKRKKIEELDFEKKDGNLILHIKQIKIKDFDKWS